MKAIRIHDFGDSDQLTMEEAPLPTPKPGEILVKIRDAGVNPVDWKIRSGRVRSRRTPQFPLTVGQDFAGEVVQFGDNTEPFKEGDHVFGFAPGAYSEYAAVPAGKMAKMPELLDFDLAAALPTPGLTALQMVRDVVKPRINKKILIHGAAGAVGAMATQLAKNDGARIFATASAKDASYLQSLGVEMVIDYKTEKFEEKLSDMDAVIDLVGGDTLQRSYGIVKKGGLVVTTVTSIDEATADKAGICAFAFFMKPNGEDLRQLAILVENGFVKPRLAEVLPLSRAKEAQDLVEHGKSHGKIVLRVA